MSKTVNSPPGTGAAGHSGAPAGKILFTASTMSHIENFHLPYLKAFEKMGWEVKAVALPVSKRFISLRNLRAIFSTRRMLLTEGFDVISSHATLAGIVTRLAVMLAGKSRIAKKSRAVESGRTGGNVKVFHTAHGYLFHDDHSLKMWAYLLPEMICGRVTDVLMVMNHEDLEIAKKYKLCGKSNKIYYIDGMGIDLVRFQQREATPAQKRAFGIEENDFVYVYAAEFSKRKNHELLLKGFAEASEKLASGQLKLVLAGDGVLLDEMKALAIALGIENKVIFLGYIKNMDELYPCCDVAVSTSRIEGLPFNIMEAMACGLPVIASDIKGHQELVTHGENGLLFESGNQAQLSSELIKIYHDVTFRENSKTLSTEKIIPFSIDNVFQRIIRIYTNH